MTDIRNIYLEERCVPCPAEVIYTYKDLPDFSAPFIRPEAATVEEREIILPVLMKNGEIGKVTLTDWVILADYEGENRWGEPSFSTGNSGKKMTSRHVETWRNENSNNGCYVYAVPSFPVEAVCVERDFNRAGLYLFLQEK